MDKTIKILNTEYHIQTSQNQFLGVWIIARKSIELRLENEDNWSSCILVSFIRKDSKTIAYIIGVYRRTEKKTEITNEVTKTLKRIRRKYNNQNILNYGDINTNNKDSVEKLEETWGFHWSELNKNTIIRSQSLKGRETNSVLDYFFSSNPIKYFHRIEQRGGSDHFPIETLFEISDNPKINKNYKITKPNRNPNKQQILELLNSDWPLKIPYLKWLSKSNILRPKVYISSEKAKIFNCVE